MFKDQTGNSPDDQQKGNYELQICSYYSMLYDTHARPPHQRNKPSITFSLTRGAMYTFPANLLNTHTRAHTHTHTHTHAHAHIHSRMHTNTHMQTLPSMKSQMQYLWSQGVPMCIEVKGQTTPPVGGVSSEDLPSVLLEQWLIQVLPRRYCSETHIYRRWGEAINGIIPLGLCSHSPTISFVESWFSCNRQLKQ